MAGGRCNSDGRGGSLKYFQIVRIFLLRNVQNVSTFMGRGGDAAHKQPTPEKDNGRSI
jgi:hypothetical protein